MPDESVPVESEEVTIEDRLDFIENKLNEIGGVCGDGHMFQQGQDQLSHCIYCVRCGEVRRLCGDGKIRGFAQS